MNAPCGCCEGTEVLTPASVANRPGLNALAYRIGVHATFLETMKASLSAAEFLELQKLTTRAANDPAIAWLDAWATVADVLTFYQERIANEGYLRTATERRSILELTRLVGYALRPGVAASVYLAYTLEKDQRVEIPAGAQAQSVPGPGELPETFETSDKLESRAEWNTLQVRLTRPQDPEKAAEEGVPLYFQGTNTKLQPNDLLLIEIDEQTPALLRVLSVTPDQAAVRTKVTYQLWSAGVEDLEARKMEAKSFASASIAKNVSRARESIEPFIRAEGFEVNTSTQTARRVIGLLENLSDEIKSVKSNAELKSVLESTLAVFREQHRLATLGRFTRLLPWIAAITKELDQLSDALAVTGMGMSSARSSGLAASVPHATSAGRTPLKDVSQLIGDLEKPAARPPANSEELPRSFATSFSATSDALPKMLVTMRQALRDLLYGAWKNLPVTERAAARVYALRTRALVFGHNAPLKLVTDPRTGRVTGVEEWPLFRTVGEPVIENLSIENSLTSGEFAHLETTVVITKAGIRTEGKGESSVLNQPVTFTINVGSEQVTVTASEPDGSAVPTRLTFVFRDRRFSIAAQRTGSAWSVTSSVLDPPALAVNNLRAAGNVTITADLESLVGRTPTEEATKVSLDASYKQIVPGSWAVLEKPLKDILITQVDRVREASRADYGMSGSGTQLELEDAWINPVTDSFAIIRGTTVFAQSELLELAEAPIDPIAEALCGERIELTNLLDGLESGRWLIVTGERADITHLPPGQKSSRRLNEGNVDSGSTTATEEVREVLPGVASSELVMLGGVEQGNDQDLPGDKTHTTLIISPGLEYCYKRDTVTIYGNVVEATHGETRSEVLGSGDGSKALQKFDLRQSPVTYVAAPTTSGVETTLQVRVNDVQWQETQSLDVLKPADRKFVTRIDDKDQMTVIFGNGVHGARLPTGVENVKAVYRTGIGKPGNAKAGQITTPLTRPLGVKKVINPLRASGGADRESRDAARRNAPLAVMALDRLVSTIDYEDFARTFAGIGKASAARLSDGQQQLVHLTIAGAGDIPIDVNSSLYRNLIQSLHRFGDPFQAVQVETRELMLLVISAKVRVLPEYLFEFVAPKIRAALLDTFGFDRRELGQSVFHSEVISAIQSIEGVAYSDLDVLDSVSETEILSPEELARKLDDMGTKASQPDSRPKQFIYVRKAEPKSQARCGNVTKTGICPAQLAFLSPDVPDTLILTELSA